MSFPRLKEEPTIFHFVLAWREGMPETPRESRGVKGLGRVIGVFSPPPLNTLAGLHQVHNAIARAQHSTPRKCTFVLGTLRCLQVFPRHKLSLLGTTNLYYPIGQAQ